jgi:membrane-associated phospholipid phosphatase
VRGCAACVIVLAALVVVARPGWAQTQAPPPTVDLGPRIYAAPEALGGALLIFGIRGVEKSHFPTECSWCDYPLNGFDAFWRDHLMWSPAHLQRAATISNVTLALSPAVAIGVAAVNRRHLPRSAENDDWWKNPCRGSWRLTCEDTAVSLEAFGIASVVTDGYKLLAARQRPMYRFMDPEDRLQHAGDSEANASFFSGHSAESFSAVMAVYETGVMRHDGSAGRIALFGFPLAAATGYLRIASDRHYMSDVLTGAAVGSAIGYMVPRLHRHVTGPALTLNPAVSASEKSLTASLNW